MPLPRNVRPEYSTTIPSSGQKIKYMPFSVKEEKILVLAAESGDAEEMANAISNILSICITHPADINIDDLALFDIEYLFLKTRAKSAGEKLKLKVTDPDDETYTVNHEINVDKIGVEKDSKHTDLIELDETTQVKMKYPGLKYFTQGLDLSSIDKTEDVVIDCISSIIMGEEVYNSSDMTKDEIKDWVESLTSEKFTKIIQFFDTMPKLKHKITLPNPNSGKKFTITLEGLSDFFS